MNARSGPQARRWRRSCARSSTATLLPNGAVLIAGGVDDLGSSLSSTETYATGPCVRGSR